jgi:hypothetical protein
VQKFDNEDVEAAVIELLRRTREPVSIDFVSHHTKMGWGTARGVLLNMTLKGQIKSVKTTKSLIFFLESMETPQKETTETELKPKRAENPEKTCGTCAFWAGHCQKNKIGKAAMDDACDEFQPKTARPYASFHGEAKGE